MLAHRLFLVISKDWESSKESSRQGVGGGSILLVRSKRCWSYMEVHWLSAYLVCGKLRI